MVEVSQKKRARKNAPFCNYIIDNTYIITNNSSGYTLILMFLGLILMLIHVASMLLSGWKHDLVGIAPLGMEDLNTEFSKC